MSNKYVSILERDEYNINFLENGMVTGYWLVFARVKADFSAKMKEQTESRGYKEKIMKLNELNELYDTLCLRNVPIDALTVQYEMSLIMQYIAHHIIKNPKTGKPEFRVYIHREGHEEDFELAPSAQDSENNSKKATRLMVVEPQQKGS